MSKRKISFDIETEDFDKIKALVKSSFVVQGDFLREAVKHSLKKFDNEILTAYIIENNALKKVNLIKDECTILSDDSPISKDLTEDFSFVHSGFLVQDGVKTRFYSKTKY